MHNNVNDWGASAVAETPRMPRTPRTPGAPREGKELFDATRPFVETSAARSWWHVISTKLLLMAALVGAAVVPWLPAQIILSVLGGLLLVRGFILYHDYMHGAILRKSRIAKPIFLLYSAVALTPSRSWNRSHNFHHGNVGKIVGSSIGSFPIMTADMWLRATWFQKIAYRICRHPITILFAYITSFAICVTLLPLCRDPRRHWDSAIVLLLHGGLITGAWLLGGFDAAFFGILLPMFIAAAIGGYLFFAQHSFEEMEILPEHEWTFYKAALGSASFMKLDPVLRWFSGNIGYHHVHHLNHRIPFYRLPEAMKAIPELQNPATTSLHPRDIIACFRVALWDEARNRMITFREFRKLNFAV